jgi:mRNA interferase MazF
VAEKDFEKWHREKIIIDGKNSRVFFAEREIWICAVGANIGFEENGAGNLFLRPILIFKKFSKEALWGIPLTHTPRSGKFYFTLSEDPKSIAILSQIRLFDAKRLEYKMGVLNAEEFELLEKAFLELVSH